MVKGGRSQPGQNTRNNTRERKYRMDPEDQDESFPRRSTEKKENREKDPMLRTRLRMGRSVRG